MMHCNTLYPENNKVKGETEMPTIGARKPATKKHELEFEEIMKTLNTFTPQAKWIKTLPYGKLRQLLGVEKKQNAEKKAILKRLDEVTRIVDILRQAIEVEQLDSWSLESRQKAVNSLERMAREGALIKAGELIEQLGWTRQALSKARKAQRVFSVEIRGEAYYPAFYTDPQYERRQLEAVSKVLGDLPGTSKLQFMLTPKGSLDSLTPLEALAKGRVADVKIAAEGFMER
jgi:hypothetical protein